MNPDQKLPPICARKADDKGHQRSHDRFELEFDIKLNIMIPEDTFRPQNLSCRTIDVSAKGMQVSVQNLHIDLYTKLLARPRNARVSFTPPGETKEILAMGRISWIDYCKPKAAEQTGPCRFGIFFADTEGPDLKAYTAFIDSIEPESEVRAA